MEELDEELPEKCCQKCIYFRPYVYEFDDNQMVSDYGECRRFPPKLVMSDERGFPVVEVESWCGEFDN